MFRVRVDLTSAEKNSTSKPKRGYEEVYGTPSYMEKVEEEVNKTYVSSKVLIDYMRDSAMAKFKGTTRELT